MNASRLESIKRDLPPESKVEGAEDGFFRFIVFKPQIEVGCVGFNQQGERFVRSVPFDKPPQAWQAGLAYASCRKFLRDLLEAQK